jgi:hypothetical protein
MSTTLDDFGEYVRTVVEAELRLSGHSSARWQVKQDRDNLRALV